MKLSGDLLNGLQSETRSGNDMAADAGLSTADGTAATGASTTDNQSTAEGSTTANVLSAAGGSIATGAESSPRAEASTATKGLSTVDDHPSDDGESNTVVGLSTSDASSRSGDDSRSRNEKTHPSQKNTKDDEMLNDEKREDESERRKSVRAEDKIENLLSDGDVKRKFLQILDETPLNQGW